MNGTIFGLCNILNKSYKGTYNIPNNLPIDYIRNNIISIDKFENESKACPYCDYGEHIKYEFKIKGGYYGYLKYLSECLSEPTIELQVKKGDVNTFNENYENISQIKKVKKEKYI